MQQPVQRPSLPARAVTHVGSLQRPRKLEDDEARQLAEAGEASVRRSRSQSNHRYEMSLQHSPIPPTLLASPLVTSPTSPFHRRSHSNYASFSSSAGTGPSSLPTTTYIPLASHPSPPLRPSTSLQRNPSTSSGLGGNRRGNASSNPISIPSSKSMLSNNPARSPVFSTNHHSYPLPHHHPASSLSSASSLIANYTYPSSYSSPSIRSSASSSSSLYSTYLASPPSSTCYPTHPSSPPPFEAAPPLSPSFTLDSLLLRPLDVPTASKRMITQTFDFTAVPQTGSPSQRRGSWGEEEREDVDVTLDGLGMLVRSSTQAEEEEETILFEPFEPGTGRWGQHGLE